MNKKYKYNFSVIIPVYNVENYLAETIDSVINQNIGFKNNIEIILVNDGSLDNSENICLEYTKKFPKNIKYVKQKNSGVSAARNKGMKYAEGEYINFLDSDDKWEIDVFKKAYRMFKKNPDIDVIGVRQKYFEAMETYLSLDYKFDKDKVVDIFNYYDHIQLSVTSAFIRNDAIGNIKYDTDVKYSEDAKFLFEIILKKEKIGFIASSNHLYRKRFSANSAIQTKNYKKDWYFITTEKCYKYVMELSKKKYGYVIPFVQYYIAYDYQWRAKENIPTKLYNEIYNDYIKITKELLSEIDDYIIMQQRNLSLEYKIELLKLKDADFYEKCICRNHKLYYNNLLIADLTSEKMMDITIINFNEINIEFRGTINCALPIEKYEIFAIINRNRKIKLELNDSNLNKRRIFNVEFLNDKTFSLKIPKKGFKNIKFQFIYEKKYPMRMNYRLGLFSKLNKRLKTYYINDNRIYYYYDNVIKSKKKTFKNSIRFKIRYLIQLVQWKKINTIIFRGVYNICKSLLKKEIWLISDRPDTANDNGYSFFKYLNTSVNDKKIKTYFIIDKKSKDYKKVKRTGKCLKYGSLKHKMCFLLSSKNISSQADGWVLNPFAENNYLYRDLYNSKFIFLQHGIIQNDLSSWLNYVKQNMFMFATSADAEYNSILLGKYGFDNNIVKLTGLSRYDYLKQNSKKIITIMPTWRMNFSSKININTGKREYNNLFNTSDYYKFYNNLINDVRLIKTLKDNNYKALFVLHHCHSANIVDFDKNATIKIESGDTNYNKIISESSLLITDYSSVAFDFSYLKKPVIYIQFDKEEFYRNQIYTKGYFNYEKDGFGPVLNDYEDAVQTIIDYIQKDCKLENKYEKRINNFFKYNDTNNCKRIYEEIKKI